MAVRLASRTVVEPFPPTSAPDAAPSRPAPTWTSPGTVTDAPRFRSDPTRFAEPRRASRVLPGSPVDRLQPRTIGQLLDGGFEVLRFRFRTIAIVAAVIVLPLYAIPQAIVVLTAGLAGSNGFDPGANPFIDASGQVSDGFLGAVGLGYLARFGLMAATMLTGVAVGYLVSSWLVGADPSPIEVLRFVRSALPRALGAFLLATVFKLLGIIPCLLGLLFLVPALSVLAPVVAIEQLGVVDSIRRSIQLTRRSFPMVAGVGILWWFASSLVSGAVGIAAVAIGGVLTGSDTGVALTTQAVDVVGTVILTVVQVAVTVLLYVDLRVRTEGFDLELEATGRFDVPVR